MTQSPLDRRSFLVSLGTVAATAAPLALPSRSTAAEPDRGAPATAEEPFLELAVATICADGFANRGHEPAFRLLPQLGIPNVEFNLWYADTITPGYLSGVRSRCATAGLRPVCLQGSSFGGEGRGGVLKDVGHKLALMYGARELGCRRIKCTGAARGMQGGLPAVIEALRELAPAAEELDQLILVENHAKNVLETIADYEEIFAAVASPHVGMCCDIAHFWGSGIDPLEVIERFHSRILHVDLKDNRTRGGGHDVVPYGEGVTDFKAILDQLHARRYRGYLLLEMAWAEPREPVLENLRRGRDLITSLARL